MPKVVKFRATLKDTGHAIKIDSDTQTEIILVVPRSDLLGMLPLVDMGKRVLWVGIIEADGDDEVKDRDFLEWLKP